MSLTLVPADQALSVRELETLGAPIAQPAETGPVCGRCTQRVRDCGIDHRDQVRHATTAHVRWCFETSYREEAEARAEQAADRALAVYDECGQPMW